MLFDWWGSARLVSGIDGQADEGAKIDAVGALEFPKFCGEVEGKGVLLLVSKGFSALSLRSGEGVGLKVGMNAAAAGFIGRSTEGRVDEDG